MKASIHHCAPVFNTSRMVADYAEKGYAPAAAGWQRLREDNMAGARDQAQWLQRISAGWDTVKILAVEDSGKEEILAGTPVAVTAQMHLGHLAPADLRVDLVYGSTEPGGDLQAEGSVPMTCEAQGEDGICRFSGTFAPDRGGQAGYAIRVLPFHPYLHNPFATGLAHWA